MGKSKKKGGGGGKGQEGKKLGHRKQRQLEQRQREDNNRRAGEALAAGIKKLGISDDSDLFAPIKLKDDCSICLVPLPLRADDSTYACCCGNIICNACSIQSERALEKVNALRASKKQEPLPVACAFCRTPYPVTDEETLSQVSKRMELNDPVALVTMSLHYKSGSEGLKMNLQKAFDLNLRAVELGYSRALNLLAHEYSVGKIIDKDEAKQRTCEEASAKGGYHLAHHYLGSHEYEAKNMKASVQHFHIAAAVGYKNSLDRIQDMHRAGFVSNDEFTAALRAYQDASIEYKSEARDKMEKK